MSEFFGRLTKRTVDEETEERLDAILSRATAFHSAYRESRSLARLPALVKAIELYESVAHASSPQTAPDTWARAQLNLGAAYSELPVGDKGANLQRAAGHYEASSQVYTLAEFPMDWGMVQNNLGTVYMDLPTGNATDNLKRAIGYFEAALRVRTEETLPFDWAKTQNNLGWAYQSLPLGDRQGNLERAIECHLAALRVYKEEDSAGDWAWTQTNLGNACRQLPGGDQKAHLQQARAYFQAAQRVFTERDFPGDWASSQNSLGTAYLELGARDMLDLSAAIHCFEGALGIFTEQTFVGEWAATQNNLANALVSRSQLGDPQKDLARAIACCEAALRVYTQEAYPLKWAALQVTLSNIYDRLETGGRASNLERSIRHCEQSLLVFTKAGSPREWAISQNNLGLAYTELPAGDIRWNVERALDCYRESLSIYTESEFPAEWARTQNNMGNAYERLPTENKRRALGYAIVCYQAALRVYTEAAHPKEWAMTNSNLGNAYYENPTADTGLNGKRALECYQAALRTYTKSEFPMDWARVQNCMGALYRREEDFRNAMACYENALTVYTEQATPWSWASACNNLAIALRGLPAGDHGANLDRAITLYHEALRVYAAVGAVSNQQTILNNLGALFFGERDWRRALATYSEAITALEQVRVSSLDDVGRRRVLSEAWRVFERAALSAIRAEDYTAALLLIERGKTRNIADHLWRKDVAPKAVSKEDWQTYQDKLTRIRATETLLNSRPAWALTLLGVTDGERNKVGLLEDLLELRQRIAALEKRFAAADPDYVPLAPPLDMEGIASLAASSGAVIVDFRVSSEGTYVLAVGPGERQVSGDQVLSIPELTTAGLRAQVTQWLSSQSEADWPKQLEAFLGQLYTTIVGPVHKLLLRRYSNGKRVIFVASQGLTLLPLHAAWWDDKDRGRKCLLDDYEISYAPSCQVLERCLSREAGFNGPARTLFAVENPTGDLPFAGWEVQGILQYFAPEGCKVLAKEQADREAVTRNIGLGEEKIFSTHGWFDVVDVEKSHLALHDGQLTIPEIVAAGLERSWLVVLSACLTGMSDSKDIMDEYQSLPAAFLVAGSHTVIASLWSVSDVSTALLMHRFHANLYVGRMAKAAALCEAQRWLRDLTYEKVVALLEVTQPPPMSAASYGVFKRRLSETAAQQGGRPFANPHWWAAFQCVGAGWSPISISLK